MFYLQVFYFVIISIVLKIFSLIQLILVWRIGNFTGFVYDGSVEILSLGELPNIVDILVEFI